MGSGTQWTGLEGAALAPPPTPGCSRSALSQLQTLVGIRVCASGATAPGLLSILTYTSCSRGLFQRRTPHRSARSLEATGAFYHSHIPRASHSPRYDLDTLKHSSIHQLGGGMKTKFPGRLHAVVLLLSPADCLSQNPFLCCPAYLTLLKSELR